MIQRYQCTACLLHSMVELPDNATVIQAVNMIQDDHNTKVINCSFHVDNIIVYQNPLHIVPKVEVPNEPDKPTG